MACDNFGSNVFESSNVGGGGVALINYHFGESIVIQLDVTVISDEQVLRFKFSVNNIEIVENSYSSDNLGHDLPDKTLLKSKVLLLKIEV